MKCLLILALCASSAYSASLPSWINKFSRADFFSSDGNLIRDEANRIRPMLVKGIPELGVETMDPLHVDKLVLRSGPLTITQNNVLFKGLGKAEVKSLRIDEKTHTGKIHLRGNFTMKSDYEMTGHLILIQVASKGKSIIKMDNTDIILKLNWELKTGDDGKKYFQAYTKEPQITFGNVRMKMDKLLGDDKVLSDTINQLLNENWRELMKDFGPPAADGVGKKIDSVLNKFYGSIPFDEDLLLD